MLEPHHSCVAYLGDAAGMADAVLGGGLENALYAGEMGGGVLAEALKEDRLDAEYLGRHQSLWESSERYKMTLAAERFRDWGCRLDRLNPNISNTMKYFSALKSKMKQMGVSGILNDVQLVLSPSFRRKMEMEAEEIPVDLYSFNNDIVDRCRGLVVRASRSDLIADRLSLLP